MENDSAKQNEKSEYGGILEIMTKSGTVDTTPNPITGEEEVNRRVVDLHDRKGLEPHLAHFMQHSVARKIQPTLEVVLDYLYSKKTYSERDDFVRIERMIEMVNEGNMYPDLTVEVLEYALAVEKAAIMVLKENMDKVESSESLKTLQRTLALRLETEDSDAYDKE